MSLKEYAVLSTDERLMAAQQAISEVSNWHTADMGFAGAIVLDVLSDETIPLDTRVVLEQSWETALNSLGMD